MVLTVLSVWVRLVFRQVALILNAAARPVKLRGHGLL